MKKLCSIKLKRNRLLSCLSVSTMCLLIFTTIVIITIISITPIIILGLGEIQAGQRDVLLYPVQDYFNATKVSQLVQQPVMPRLSIPVDLNSEDDYATAWFMDFKLQDENHLGNIGVPPDRPGNYIYTHNQFGYSINQIVNVHLRYNNVLKTLSDVLLKEDSKKYREVIYQIDVLTNGNIQIKGKFQVVGVFSDSLGKFPVGSVGGYCYLDIRTAYQHIIKQTYENNNLDTKNSALLNYMENDFDLAVFSTQATINIPNRIQTYSNSDYDATYYYLSSFGAQILQKVGIFSLQTQIPIASNLTDLSYFGMFIGVILKLIILTLFILSILMMNNMLNVGIQRKSFDFALIKTMGAGRSFIIFSLFFDSMQFVILANVIAFPFAYMLLNFISFIFEDFFGYQYQITPNVQSIIGGFFIGVLVPVVSSIVPIWGILKDDLAQNLNPISNKTQAIRTQIYVEGRQFPIGKMIFGVLATSYGLMIYYLLPKGLINEDVSLLLFVFFAILAGLLGGLILLSYSFQYLVQKIIAYLTLFWINKTDFILTLKNLAAHRMKNRRSSLLYALSVSFIIFVSVGISIQMQTIENQMLKKHGTYIQISSPYGSLERSFYDKILPTYPEILQWAYITERLDYYTRRQYDIKSIQVSDEAKLYISQNRIYGVSPNLLSTLSIENLPLTKSFAHSPYDPYSYLHSPNGYMTATIGYYLGKKFNILSDNNNFIVSMYTQNSVQRIKLKASSIFNSRVGLGYSKFLFGRNQIGVSYDTYMKLGKVPSYHDLPYKNIKIKIKPGTDTEDLGNRLRKQISAKNPFDYIWQFSEVKGTLTKINDLLKSILNFLLVLVLIISFFSLVTTCYVNIINQNTQIAILLTLGYTKRRIVAIFIYESFILVLSSCLIGVLVGFSVAWLMGSQRQLFGDFPVSIQVDGLPIIAVSAVISSILSTIWPIWQLFRNPINQIFKYQ